MFLGKFKYILDDSHQEHNHKKSPYKLKKKSFRNFFFVYIKKIDQ